MENQKNMPQDMQSICREYSLFVFFEYRICSCKHIEKYSTKQDRKRILKIQKNMRQYMQGLLNLIGVKIFEICILNDREDNGKNASFLDTVIYSKKETAGGPPAVQKTPSMEDLAKRAAIQNKEKQELRSGGPQLRN